MPGIVLPTPAPRVAPIGGRNTSGATVSTAPLGTGYPFQLLPGNAPTKVAAPAAAAAKPKAAPGLDIAGMQRFLVSKGFKIAVDGVNGPITQAAAAAFRSHADPDAFNVSHGQIQNQAPAATDASSSGPVAAQKAAAPVKVAPKAAPRTTAAAATTQAGPTDAQTAQQTVAAIINPIIAQIKAAETARAAQGQNLINGYTGNAEQQLKGINFGAPYSDAASGQNAVNTALLAALQGAGGQDQNQLAGELASLGSPSAAAAATGRAGADTAGAGNAGLATGDASLSSLLAQGAAAKTYGNKLPGVEALAGAQDTAKLQGGVTADQSTQLQSIEAKVPGMVQSELTGLSNARSKAVHDQIAALIADGKTAEALRVAEENNQTKLTIAGENNQTKEQIAAQTAAFKKAGLATKGQPTDTDLSKLIQTWHTGKLSSVTTIARDANGNPIPNSAGAPETTTQTVPTGQLNYMQAYQQLRGVFHKTDAQARQLLDTAYPRGQQGRAWVTNEEQSALKNAGQPTKAMIINGHGVLTPKQYTALKAAGKLPPGQLTSEGAYVITSGQ